MCLQSAIKSSVPGRSLQKLLVAKQLQAVLISTSMSHKVRQIWSVAHLDQSDHILDPARKPEAEGQRKPEGTRKRDRESQRESAGACESQRETGASQGLPERTRRAPESLPERVRKSQTAPGGEPERTKEPESQQDGKTVSLPTCQPESARGSESERASQLPPRASRDSATLKTSIFSKFFLRFISEITMLHCVC